MRLLEPVSQLPRLRRSYHVARADDGVSFDGCAVYSPLAAGKGRGGRGTHSTCRDV